MTYEVLKQNGIKIDEDDFNDGLYHVYAGTRSFWLLDDKLFAHEIHTNSLVYTGNTGTYLTMDDIKQHLNKYSFMAFKDIGMTYEGYKMLCNVYDATPCEEY